MIMYWVIDCLNDINIKVMYESLVFHIGTHCYFSQCMLSNVYFPQCIMLKALDGGVLFSMKITFANLA